ncbi:MAG: glutathione S-transferase family protein [Gammaproteobacteria bacterium]
MTELTLVIGNQNYSSWSLRPWLYLKHHGIPFTEIRIPLDTPQTRDRIARYSLAGRVPVLIDGTLTVWESLAILEYLAERFPDTHGWPTDREQRAVARAVANEMHAGFAALRTEFPMNCRARITGVTPSTAAQTDIARIQAIWRDCRSRHGGGPWLFGEFSIADAMYAPVATRFVTYGIAVDPVSQAYIDTVIASAAMQAWLASARAETEVLSQYEPRALSAARGTK